MHAAEALGKKVIMILGPTSRQTGAGTISKIQRLFKKTSGADLVHKMESSLVIEKHRNV